MLVNILVVFTIIDLIHLLFADDSNIILYNKIENCKPTEYFDVNYFLCRLCDLQLNLVPSENGLSCVCDPKATIKIEYDSNLRHPICLHRNCTNPSLNCTQSAAHSLTLFSKCYPFHLKEAIVAQASKSIQIYRIESKTKITCDDDTTSSTLNCIDPKNYDHYENYCIPTYLLKEYQNYKHFKLAQLHDNSYGNSGSSNIINDVFLNLDFLMFFCQTMRINEYCEYAANLCVLTMYNLDKYSPCNIFFATQTTLINTGIDGYQTKLVPFLFYPKGKNAIDDLNKVIDFRYKYTKNENDYTMDGNNLFGHYLKTNKISLILVGHDLKGDLQIIEPLRIFDFNLCTEKLSTRKSIRFGENVANTCALDLRTLIEMGERRPWFFNLYLNYTENNLSLMKSVPILIRNAFSHNKNPYNREQWQLVRRFFFVDTFSTRNKSFHPQRYSGENFASKYTMIRYVRRLELRFELNEYHNFYGNKIAVPILILDYADIDMQVYRSGGYYEIEFEFLIIFKKTFSMSTFFHIILTMGITAAIGMAIFQTFSHKQRKQQIDYDSTMLMQFGIYLCSTMANVFFGLAIILNIYIYFIYKTQHTVKVLPPFDELKMIKTFFVLAFLLKAIKFGNVLSEQIYCDIFFIDWERPRVFEHQITLKPTNNLDTPSICSSARQYQQNEGLSAWRTYFIANEWIKLATKRKCSMCIQILLVLLTLIIFNFDWSHLFTFKAIFHWPWTSQADRAIRNGQSLEMLAIALIIYTSCYFIQRIFIFLIYERYVSNAIQQFVDICSMSNISVFIFAIDSYGYYIHGRSPHGFADTDMCSMLQQLRRESENMCGHRGLLPNSEHQTFCFLAPIQLRTLYDKLKATLRKPIHDLIGPHNYRQNGIESNGKFYEQNLQQIANANTTINRFLSAFIDHGLKDLDYIIQEKTIVENIFDFEFESNVTENRGTFYLDNGNSFDKVLFYGNENLLFTMDLMLFICLIVICGNFLFAILFVGVTHEILKHTVKYFVKKNLSKQTLIDERFLI